MTRTEAEIKLSELFGFERFHDLQWQVIEQLMAGQRVLFIEKACLVLLQVYIVLNQACFNRI